MPYSDVGVWFHSRRPEDQYDTWKSAAEAFVKATEEYLYDTKSPAYFNASFLAWHIGQYDVDKVSSGHAFNQATYDHEQAAAMPVAPVATSADQYIGFPGYPVQAHQNPAIDTGPTDPGAGAVGSPPAVAPVPAPAPPVVAPDPAVK